MKVATTKKCLVCKKEFKAKRSDAQFCSPKCRQKYIRNGLKQFKTPEFNKKYVEPIARGENPYAEKPETGLKPAKSTQKVSTPSKKDLAIKIAVNALKTIELHKDYVNVKNIGILRPDGTIKKISLSKQALEIRMKKLGF